MDDQLLYLIEKQLIAALEKSRNNDVHDEYYKLFTLKSDIELVLLEIRKSRR